MGTLKINQNLNGFTKITTEIINQKTVEYIILLVTQRYNLLNEDYLTSKNRKREYCLPRQVAMYLMNKHTTFSKRMIGTYFNGKNHATVLHATKTVKNLTETDKEFRLNISELNDIVKQKSKAIKSGEGIENHFYHIDFNNHVSIKVKDGKGILLTGFDETEIDKIKEFIGGIIDTRIHENTGLIILEQIKQE